MPQPLSTTASPAAMPSWAESRTTPAKSMPGIIGQRRTTGDEPVRARPSLKFSDEWLTATVTSPSMRSDSSTSVQARDWGSSSCLVRRKALKVGTSSDTSAALPLR